jgi:hypothetical protein
MAQYYPHARLDLLSMLSRHGLVSSLAPFTSLTVNRNVSTLPHMDRGDRGNCCVMPVGDFRGGASLFPSLNLSVESTSGQMLVFDSASLVHGNAVVDEGTRYSWVFHADSHLWKRISSW